MNAILPLLSETSDVHMSFSLATLFGDVFVTLRDIRWHFRCFSCSCIEQAIDEVVNSIEGAVWIAIVKQCLSFGIRPFELGFCELLSRIYIFLIFVVFKADENL